MIEEMWQCQNCQTVHETEYKAENCCPPELVWQCPVCNEVYWDSDVAKECEEDHKEEK